MINYIGFSSASFFCFCKHLWGSNLCLLRFLMLVFYKWLFLKKQGNRWTRNDPKQIAYFTPHWVKGHQNIKCIPQEDWTDCVSHWGGTARDGVLELSPVCSFLLAVNQHNSTNMAGFVRFCVSVCVSLWLLIDWQKTAWHRSQMQTRYIKIKWPANIFTDPCVDMPSLLHINSARS